MSEDSAAARYFAESLSWDRDRWAAAHASARRAWWVAGVAAGMAALAVLAVVGLTPLKQVQPFVIRVDNTTGIVDVVPELRGAADAAGASGVPETVTRYLLTHFVLVRERFNLSTAEADYAEVGAFQSPALNQVWYTLWNPGNPESPLKRYQDGTELTVNVQAVTFLPRSNGVNDLAQVRYIVTRLENGDSPAEVAHSIATIQYAYAAPSTNPKVRQWNPLGFRILAFHSDREVLAAPGIPQSRPAASRPVAAAVSPMGVP
jgi:type IV secretion system protein VirB8